MVIFNKGWNFSKSPDSGFSPVELPHDWLISDTGRLYESGAGWYRRELDASFLKDGQKLFVRFDGVYMNSTLFVNGILAGEWKYGYTTFEFDITELIARDSPNTLLLKVDFETPCSRWYTGAGIYRDVWLKIKNACHFVSDGIYVTTFKREDGAWAFEADAEVETGGRPYELRHTLIGAENGIESWDVDNPRLYTLRSELIVGGEVADSEDTRVGFREIKFTPDDGFFLNGRRLKLNGVCLHHDLGALGAAVRRDAIRRQLSIMRGMGVNALRTAHNPPAKAFMELADEMGFLVMSELTDMWELPKNTYDYARFFGEWAERDTASWIRRDRNHPSVIMWSIGNEIYDTHADAESGGKTMRRLMELVRRHDPKGHAPATFCSNYMPWENTQRCADIIKLVGYNYAEYLYDRHHAEHPDWIIFGGETCSTAQSRGVYHFPLSKSILADDDLQCSALGNSATSWGAKSVEACIAADRDRPYSLGQFVWAGQDYIGEPTPYHTKNSYLGHVDTAGFPKDSYYLFKAAWTDFKKAPVIHLYPYWDFSPGQPVDVRVCSNAPAAELFLGGESLGKKEIGGRISADWSVPYAPGVLRAVALDENGNAAAEAERRSFGDAESLRVEAEDWGELVFATITAADREGNAVENANRRVNVSVSDGTLLGLDNGDAADYDQYSGSSRRLFGGKLLAVVKKHGGSEPVIRAEFDADDIPIRKIELAAEGYNVTARVFPHDATYRDLYWRLTDAGGIDSPIGTLEVSPGGTSAVIRPRGDGEAFVRCCAKNGREHVTLISQLPLTVTGMGKPFLDPYSFVSGGLYGASNVALTNGNERGVATLRDGVSHVGFRDLDFGDYGSDEVTLPLFPLSKEPFTFEIWEGMPDEGGQKLCGVLYDKGSVWNTYTDVVCKLPRRLRGVSTLCLVFDRKVHVKGFVFTRLQKAFERLPAAGCDSISGDSYALAGDAVENIGNNVTIAFENMDFGDSGTEAVEICRRSEREKNSVLLLFSGDGGEERVMVELGRSDEYSSAVFPLGRKICGTRKVSLIFLPGCRLDLGWIRFIGSPADLM